MKYEDALYVAAACLSELACVGNDDAADAHAIIVTLAGRWTQQRIRRQERRRLRRQGANGRVFHNGISGKRSRA